MAKAIYVCSRNHPLVSNDEARLKGICEALTPDNIVTPVSHRVSVKDLTAYAVMNYQPSILEKQNSLLLGYLYDRNENWNEPLTDSPDGSYAIFRVNDDHFEAVSDPVASRTIWYYFDDDLFIASTSQRAIIMFLGSFHFDERIIPWMLSSGTLGPGYSWDKRLTMLPVDSSVILDRTNWAITTRQTSIRYSEKPRADAEHRRVLEEAVAGTFESLKDMDLNQWVIALSGGRDSRAILCWLKESGLIDKDFRAITWGLERALEDKSNDAGIAKDVAAASGVKHKYYLTDITEEPIGLVIDRFLFCVEGRSDHLSAYMDGMKIWKVLLEDNVRGIFKGDQYFGWPPVPSSIQGRLQVGCQLCSDQSNLTSVIERFGLPDQEFPGDLMRKDESLMAWRDRLYVTYRIPTFIAAISDIKFSYLEQITPLLSRRILDRTRELPDRLRVNKGTFKEMVDAVSPDLPYAERGAPERLEDILRNGQVVELITGTLNGDYARTLFSKEFLDWVIKGISTGAVSSRKRSGSLRKSVRKYIPKFIRNLLIASGAVLPELDRTLLAFRVFIIIRMHQILSDDGIAACKSVAGRITAW